MMLTCIIFTLLFCARATRLYHSVLRAKNRIDAPILILHGLLGSSRNFQTWTKILHEKTDGKSDIICFDLRNHGRTYANIGSQEISYVAMAEDVIETLQYLRISECYIVGHSMGGKVAAMASLLNQREKKILVNALCILDICPVAYPEEDFSSVLTTIDNLVSTQEAVRTAQSKGAISKLIDTFTEDTSLRAFLMSNIQYKGDKFGWKFCVDSINRNKIQITGFDLPDLIPYSGPTLLLKGGNSNFVRLKYLETVKSFFPNYTLVSEKACGHWLHFEKPHETTDKVVGFIKYSKAMTSNPMH